MRSSSSLLREYIRESVRSGKLIKEAIPDSATPDLRHAILFFVSSEGAGNDKMAKLINIVDQMEGSPTSNWIKELDGLLADAKNYDDKNADLVNKGVTGLLMSHLILTSETNLLATLLGRILSKLSKGISASVPDLIPTTTIRSSTVNEFKIPRFITDFFSKGGSKLAEVSESLQKDAVNAMRRMISATPEADNIFKNLEGGDVNIRKTQITPIYVDDAGNTVPTTGGTAPMGQALRQVLDQGSVLDVDPEVARAVMTFPGGTLNDFQDLGGDITTGFTYTTAKNLLDHIGGALNIRGKRFTADQLVGAEYNGQKMLTEMEAMQFLNATLVPELRMAVRKYEVDVSKIVNDPDTLADVFTRGYKAHAASKRVPTSIGKKIGIGLVGGAGVSALGVGITLLSDLLDAPNPKAVSTLTNDLFEQAKNDAATVSAIIVETDPDYQHVADKFSELSRLVLQ
jgi:hypothetical protein